jgi:hypothetical protein
MLSDGATAMIGELLHTHYCPICWTHWECQDPECGEGIIENEYDIQFLTGCRIETFERSRACDDCLTDPDRFDAARAPEDDYEFERERAHTD